MPPVISTTSSSISMANRWDHFLARSAIRRTGHLVQPGLFALGNPTPESPVFVTANYTLSFDALRAALAGIDGYILVLDTDGVNVWCAAGKGTLGTDELVRRIEATGLADVVSHRTIILPQLGAPGVAAHEVKQRSGFKVEYGPVRAADLPGYLRTHEATPDMRRVRFGLLDRAVLIPVELAHVLLPMLIVAVVFFFIGGYRPAAAVVAATLAGVVLFPVLLPWIPVRALSGKGFILGALVALPFALSYGLSQGQDTPLWRQVGGAFAYILAMPPVTAFAALNFTGATTFTSRTGVRREMFGYIPRMAGAFGTGTVLAIVLTAI
jgi:hypothetical protein